MTTKPRTSYVQAALAVLALLTLQFSITTPALAQASDPATDRAAAERCQALEGSAFADLPSAPTHIVRASLRPATKDRPAICAVEGYVSPAVNFGLFMPIDGWNGRYLVRGCGGSCGTVAVDLACTSHVRDGYACLHTDMGHRSTLSDNNWVKDNLSGLVDFGYRATHVTTKAGRAVLKAFYGSDARKSYFFACSTGGRQALIEAQRFPDDFDGIVAIAPASMAPFGNTKPATITDIDAFNTRPHGRPILPNRKALLLHRAAVKQCDKDDGITDGIIGKPLQCRFRPAQLQCKTGPGKAGEGSDCLSADQVAVAEKLYDWRGAMPGSEFNWIGNFIRNAPVPGDDWQPLFDLGQGRGDPVVIETMIAPNNPDLRPFRNRGGKLILVHGWSDFSVMPPPTIDYYETLTRTMGGQKATEQFARMFMIPGMDHCSGGDGAWAVNYMAAITDWVENDKAPDALRGVKPVPGAPIDYFGVDLPLMDRKYIAFERDHRAWPADSVAVGGSAKPTNAQSSLPLDQALSAALQQAESTGTKAGYPRRSTLNLILKTLWETLYRTNGTAEQQRAALAAIQPDQLTPLGREAVARMQAEITLD